MKVNIDKTIEVSDEQRKAIARYIDGPFAKKRDATRDEMKTFLWDNGSNWEDVLDGPAPAPTDETYIGHVDVTHDDSDLIGDADGMDLI